LSTEIWALILIASKVKKKIEERCLTGFIVMGLK